MLSNGLKLDISFLMLLILFSSVSMSLLKSNHASAISVGGILGVAKEAMDIVPALVSAAQSLGIRSKGRYNNITVTITTAAVILRCRRLKTGNKSTPSRVSDEIKHHISTINCLKRKRSANS